jgi:hypothetical protein
MATLTTDGAAVSPAAPELRPDYEIPLEHDLPLEVVPDWDQQVNRAGRMCRLIDQHLNIEARGRFLRDLLDFRPQHLCPEQRVQMVSDVYAATH